MTGIESGSLTWTVKLECVGSEIYGALNLVLRWFWFDLKTSGAFGNELQKGTVTKPRSKGKFMLLCKVY